MAAFGRWGAADAGREGASASDEEGGAAPGREAALSAGGQDTAAAAADDAASPFGPASVECVSMLLEAKCARLLVPGQKLVPMHGCMRRAEQQPHVYNI